MSRRRISVDVLKSARKPTKKELSLFMKMTALGIGVLGSLSFVIKLIFSYIWMAGG